MGFGSYSFLVGPVIAAIAVAGLMLVSRWMTGQKASSLIEREAQAGPPEEYGLMIPVASPRTNAAADQLQAQLGEAGVSSRAVPTTEGLRVMVWAEDVARARAVLDGPPR